MQRQLPWSVVAEMGVAARTDTVCLPASSYKQVPPETVAQLGSAVNQQVTNPFFGIITDPTSSPSLPTAQRGQLPPPYPQFLSVSDAQVRVERRNSCGLAVLFA